MHGVEEWHLKRTADCLLLGASAVRCGAVRCGAGLGGAIDEQLACDV